mmetsp:Transcript_40370/g.94496  ORF Transcript_40370/g.94496 Transcript_40370/m.94496 type:complete len:228 (-) Transcript_40370:3375-4058(-)
MPFRSTLAITSGLVPCTSLVSFNSTSTPSGRCLDTLSRASETEGKFSLSTFDLTRRIRLLAATYAIQSSSFSTLQARSSFSALYFPFSFLSCPSYPMSLPVRKLSSVAKRGFSVMCTTFNPEEGLSVDHDFGRCEVFSSLCCALLTSFSFCSSSAFFLLAACSSAAFCAARSLNFVCKAALSLRNSLSCCTLACPCFSRCLIFSLSSTILSLHFSSAAASCFSISSF